MAEVYQAQKIFEQPDIAKQYQESFAYYPKVWQQPYLNRRKENGAWLYGLLKISKMTKPKCKHSFYIIMNFMVLP